LVAAIVPLGVRASWANEHAPDPRMLLDLDLFASAPGEGSQGTNTSMIEQIRTLRAMGYLNANTPPPPPQPDVRGLPPPPEDTEDDVRE